MDRSEQTTGKATERYGVPSTELSLEARRQPGTTASHDQELLRSRRQRADISGLGPHGDRHHDLRIPGGAFRSVPRNHRTVDVGPDAVTAGPAIWQYRRAGADRRGHRDGRVRNDTLHPQRQGYRQRRTENGLGLETGHRAGRAADAARALDVP